MPWRVTYDAQAGLVETLYQGVVTSAELSAAIEATIVAGGLHQCHRFLGDCRTLEGGHTIFDLFAKVEELDDLGLAGQIREAVLLPASGVAARDVEFWQTACTNRGLDVQLFTDRDVALAWLLADG